MGACLSRFKAWFCCIESKKEFGSAQRKSGHVNEVIDLDEVQARMFFKF